MDKIKIGVIGAGSISDYHLQAYAALPHAEIAAICDMNEERARAKADKYGAAKAYKAYEELLADAGIEAVSICTWNETHAEIAIAALKAGKHVLVEKPLSRTVEEALEVERAVKETGKLLQVGFVRRYDSNLRLLKSFADAGEFGELYYGKASCLRRLGNPGGWFADVERSGGGPLIDLGVHVIDICWYLMGRPKAVSVTGNAYRKLGNRSNVKHLDFYKAADYDPTRNTVEDLANALIRFENGASLFVDVSYTLHARQNELSVKLYGDQGGFELEPALQIVTEKHDTILNVTPQTNNASFDFAGAFRNEIAHFVECVRSGEQPISPVEDGVAVMKMLRAIYESASAGREVRLDG